MSSEEEKTHVGGVFLTLVFFGFLVSVIFNLAENLGPLVWGLICILYFAACGVLAFKFVRQ